MQNSPTSSGSADVDAQVGQAWSKHYHGEQEGAVQAFRQILEKWPDHIDANYGLALALKAAGQKQQASESFQKTKTLVQAALAAQHDESARYQMLSKMIEQHLSTLTV